MLQKYEEKHYIEWVEAIDALKSQRKLLKLGDKPAWGLNDVGKNILKSSWALGFSEKDVLELHKISDIIKLRSDLRNFYCTFKGWYYLDNQFT